MLLKDESAQVREVIAAQIGTIGIPEGHACIDALCRIINREDEDPNVKAMAVWAIGKLSSPEIGLKV